jgi:ferredoxin-type protein NapG
MSGESELSRRHFIKSSVLSIAKTAQEYVKHRDAKSDCQTKELLRTDWLRPPGAAPESMFLERCTYCGDCAKVCPYESIKHHPADGSPIIFADVSPCHLCEDLPCINACETGALLPIEGREFANMGLAAVSYRDCTAAQGCHACVSRCPTNALAMDFAALRIDVVSERCAGCGLCEQVCVTVNDKKAIRIMPARLNA